MYQKKMQEDIRCPLEYGLEVFGGKWKPRIICVLAEMDKFVFKLFYFCHDYLPAHRDRQNISWTIRWYSISSGLFASKAEGRRHKTPFL